MLLASVLKRNCSRTYLFKSERELYIDSVKIFASFAVVMLHVNSNTLHSAEGLSNFQQIAVHALHQLLYAFVPVFMLCTGAVFLARPAVITYKKMLHNIIKITGCILAFGSMFWLIERAYTGQSLWSPPGEAALAILTDSTWSHMWYLYVTLGIYIIIPVLSGYVHQASLQGQVIFCAILFTWNLYCYVAGMIGFMPANILPIKGMWVFYVMAGGIIGRIPAASFKKFLPLVMLFVTASAALILQKGFQGYDRILLEEHPYTIIFAVSVFILVKILCNDRKAGRRGTIFSGCTLGIYIIHPIFVHLMVKVVGWNPQYFLPVLSLPLTAVGVWIVSWICVFLALKILKCILPHP